MLPAEFPCRLVIASRARTDTITSHVSKASRGADLQVRPQASRDPDQDDSRWPMQGDQLHRSRGGRNRPETAQLDQPIGPAHGRCQDRFERAAFQLCRNQNQR